VAVKKGAGQRPPAPSIFRTFELKAPTGGDAEVTAAAAVRLLISSNEDRVVSLVASVLIDQPGAGRFYERRPSNNTAIEYAVVGGSEGAVNGSSGSREAYILAPDTPTVLTIPKGTDLYAAARNNRIFLSMVVSPLDPSGQSGIDLRSLGEEMMVSLSDKLGTVFVKALAAFLPRRS